MACEDDDGESDSPGPQDFASIYSVSDRKQGHLVLVSTADI